MYTNRVSLRYNALGAANRFQVDYRRRLFDDPSPLKASAYAAVGAQLRLSPASGQVGIVATLQPIAPLLVSVGYSFQGWFGSIASLQSFDRASANHSDTRLSSRTDAGLNYATTGHKVRLRLRLRGRVGGLVFINNTVATYASVGLKKKGMDPDAGTRVFYSRRLDDMVGNQGWVITNGTVVGWRTDVGLMLAARSLLTHAFYRSEHLGGNPRPLDGPSVVVGPLATYEFFRRAGESFDRPTIGLFVGWWLQHRYRTGVDVAQAVPQIMLFFAFGGQLWAHSSP